MSEKSVIGITSYPYGDTHGYHVPRFYVDSILRAGGTPIILPSTGKASVINYLKLVDGVVLAGGGDISPERFTDDTHETIYNLNPQRDETELEMAEILLKKKIPTFCICRGLQVLNVVLGGTLHLHLPDTFGENIPHRLPPREPVLHEVNIDPNSNLYKILGKEKIQSMSWHHQSVRVKGRGVRVVATAPDGVVEAIEVENHPQILAVQWHPELSSESDKLQQKLFNEFVDMCKTK